MMSDDDDRDAITAFLQEQGPGDHDRPAVLVGWALVLDWSDDEGDRLIGRAWSPGLAKWHAAGMFHEALYGDWSGEDN